MVSYFLILQQLALVLQVMFLNVFVLLQEALVHSLVLTYTIPLCDETTIRPPLHAHAGFYNISL